MQVGIRGFEIGFFELVISLFLGGFLFAHTGGFEQFHPAFGGGFGESEVGIGLRDFGFGLGQLLVQFRRVNLGEQLAGGHVLADVDIPAFQITAGAREDRRFHIRLHFSRERHAQLGFAGRRRNDGHVLRRILHGFARQGAAGNHARHQANSQSNDNQDDGDNSDGPELDRARRWRVFRGDRVGGRSYRWIRVHTHQVVVGLAAASAAAAEESSAWLRACERRCIKLKTTGTNNSVAIVAMKRPPITARPSGAFCSPPSPRPRLIGNMPINMAAAVISTGRMRLAPASSAAATGSIPRRRLSRAKLTTSTEFAVATPRLMIAPIKAGTLKVVCNTKSAQITPASAPGNAVMMMNGSSQLWKLMTSRK